MAEDEDLRTKKVKNNNNNNNEYKKWASDFQNQSTCEPVTVKVQHHCTPSSNQELDGETSGSNCEDYLQPRWGKDRKMLLVRRTGKMGEEGEWPSRVWHTQREEKTPRRHLFNPSMSGLQEWLNFSHLMRLHKVFLECINQRFQEMREWLSVLHLYWLLVVAVVVISIIITAT